MENSHLAIACLYHAATCNVFRKQKKSWMSAELMQKQQRLTYVFFFETKASTKTINIGKMLVECKHAKSDGFVKSW